MAEDSVRKLLFLPSRKGMDIIDRKQGKTFIYLPNERLLTYNRRILQVDTDRFLLTNGFGVSMLNLATNKVTHYNLNKFLKNFFPLSAYMLNEDKLIMNLDSGCLILRTSDGLATRLTSRQGFPQILAGFFLWTAIKNFFGWAQIVVLYVWILLSVECRYTKSRMDWRPIISSALCNVIMENGW